jgi:hypothetical protein
MKKIVMTAALVCLWGSSALAGTITQGQQATCKDANSIAIEVQTIANESKDKFGYTSNDRGTANLVVWKSSNFTTIPLTLGPNDNNATVVGADHGLTGLESRGSMGVNKVVLTKQPAFSRGDSIGDISGEVRITNVGLVPVSVTCQ